MAKKVNTQPLVTIIGPTAGGKSRLAVQLAKQFRGEVISADSRQVYRGLDIGSGKITTAEQRGIPHHLLNIANPQRTFTVAQYQKLALGKLQDIWRRGKLPILCGGTGFYIEAVIKGTVLPQTPPNIKVRARLEKKSTAELVRLLRQRDPARARAIDTHNRHRLVRALEIVAAAGKVPTVPGQPPTTNTLIIGLKPPPQKLRQLINHRLRSRLRHGLVNEVRQLHHGGLSWAKLGALGLEYRYVANFLQGKITRVELEQVLNTKIWQYTRRQMTWFKRMPGIHWVTSTAAAERQVGRFLTENKNPSFASRKTRVVV